MAELPEFLNWKPVDLGEPRSALEPPREDDTAADIATTPREGALDVIQRVYSRVPLGATEAELDRKSVV